MIKAVIFDLDGTLLDTLSDIANSLNEAIASLGCDPYDDETVRSFIGNGVVNLVRLALENQGIYKHVDDTVTRFREIYSEKYNIKTKPYKDIELVLEKAKAMGLALGVCSNKPNPLTQLLIAEHFNDTFDFVLGEVDFIARKPAPDMALEVAANLGALPREVLFVGDSTVDVQTAKSAKMIMAAMSYGFNDKAILEAAEPHYILDDAQALLKVIEALH